MHKYRGDAAAQEIKHYLESHKNDTKFIERARKVDRLFKMVNNINEKHDPDNDNDT